jgi:hypothetical protein
MNLRSYKDSIDAPTLDRGKATGKTADVWRGKRFDNSRYCNVLGDIDNHRRRAQI